MECAPSEPALKRHISHIPFIGTEVAMIYVERYSNPTQVEHRNLYSNVQDPYEKRKTIPRRSRNLSLASA